MVIETVFRDFSGYTIVIVNLGWNFWIPSGASCRIVIHHDRSWSIIVISIKQRTDKTDMNR